jgi:DNA-binding CsgD family transcriptional regulator
MRKCAALFGFVVTPMMFARIFTQFYPIAADFGFRFAFDTAAAVTWAILLFLGSEGKYKKQIYFCLSSVLLITGSFAQLIAITLADGSSGIIILASCCFGIGYAIYCCLWISIYESLEPTRSLVYIAGSFAVGAMVSNLPMLLVPDTLAYAIICMLIHAAVMLFSLMLLYRLIHNLATSHISPQRSAVYPMQGLSKLPYYCVLFVTSFVSSFIIGLLVVNAFDYENHGGLIIVIALVSFAFVTAALSRYLRKSLIYLFAYYMSSLMVAAILLLVSVSVSGGMNGFLWMLSFAVAPLFDIVLFAMLAASRFNLGVSSWRLICAVYCLNEIGYLVGSALEGIVTVNIGSLICMSTLVVYIVYLIVITISNMVRIIALERGMTGNPSFQAFTEHHKITQREREVLVYLLQGRSYESIAHKLCIAPSTVKTHVSHIYAKLDVSTRDELLDLANIQE